MIVIQIETWKALVEIRGVKGSFVAGPLKFRLSSRDVLPVETVDGCCFEGAASLCSKEVGVEVKAGGEMLFPRGDISRCVLVVPELGTSAAVGSEVVGVVSVGGASLMPRDCWRVWIWDSCDMSFCKCVSNSLFCMRRCSTRACSKGRKIQLHHHCSFFVAAYIII